MNLDIRKLFHRVVFTGLGLAAAGSVSHASMIMYNTNSSSTGFVTGGSPSLTLTSTSGVAATLTYTPTGNTTVGTPSNGNYGLFNLDCNTCSTQAQGTASATFSPFTFDLVIDDTTDNAVGEFVGTSSGSGQVYSDTSDIIINWLPIQLGPGTSNAMSGNFGNTSFIITQVTRIVPPTGLTGGVTTVQGTINSAPEPATFALLGTALLGIGFAGHWKFLRS